jgi:protein TonB
LKGTELSFGLGVYPDMFEQSILLDAEAGKKVGALFASVSAQIAGIGVLVLIPLIYTETLPLARLPFTLPMPVSQPAQPPVENVKPSANASRPNVFHAPFRIPTSPASSPAPSQTIGVDLNAPLVSGAFSAPATLADFGLQLLQTERPAPAPPVSTPLASPKPSVAEPLKVSSELQAAKILNKILPQYPALARQARISGTVKLMGIIAKDGTVQKLQVISGHPLLQRAALDAVSQWRYQPTILDGQPVEVIAPIDVIFTLSE